jgi:hypothetical protein
MHHWPVKYRHHWFWQIASQGAQPGTAAACHYYRTHCNPPVVHFSTLSVLVLTGKENCKSKTACRHLLATEKQKKQPFGLNQILKKKKPRQAAAWIIP